MDRNVASNKPTYTSRAIARRFIYSFIYLFRPIIYLASDLSLARGSRNVRRSFSSKRHGFRQTRADAPSAHLGKRPRMCKYAGGRGGAGGGETSPASQTCTWRIRQNSRLTDGEKFIHYAASSFTLAGTAERWRSSWLY